MLTISREQLTLIETSYFRSRCVAFVVQELELFDLPAESEVVMTDFDTLSRTVDSMTRGGRIEVTMLLLAKLAFPQVYAHHQKQRRSLPFDERVPSLQNELGRQGYDAAFLHRKPWI